MRLRQFPGAPDMSVDFSPPRAESFEHEALFYDGPVEFVSGTVPFIREALAADEPVMVAVVPERIALLEEALGDEAAGVRFVDMTGMGRNPARIIPAWRAFLDEHGGRGAVHGIGEPVFAGRRASELTECQLHEALLNTAFAQERGFRLMCPYDVGVLGESVAHQARCSHPVVSENLVRAGSPHYRDAADAPYVAPLPPPPSPAATFGFDGGSLHDVRELVEEQAQRAGLVEARIPGLVLAVHEIACNSVVHGGGRGVLRIWQDDDDAALVSEVRDRGRIDDPLVGRRTPPAAQGHGYGVWLANQMCDLVQIRSTASGTVVRLHMAVE